MNWYLQQKQSGKLRDFGKGVGISTLVGLPMLGAIPRGPHPAQGMPPQTQVAPVQPPLRTETPVRPPPKPTAAPETIPPPTPAQTKPSAVNVDIKKIIQIESNGRSDAVSGVGAAGVMQIMPATWAELVKKMGKNYSMQDRFDRAKNIEVGTYYMNVEIPRMLKSFGVPDSLETRLAAYNWGAGAVRNAYRKFGQQWLQHAPKETQDYVRKYRS